MDLTALLLSRLQFAFYAAVNLHHLPRQGPDEHRSLLEEHAMRIIHGKRRKRSLTSVRTDWRANGKNSRRPRRPAI
jgi:hypothetical protein